MHTFKYPALGPGRKAHGTKADGDSLSYAAVVFLCSIVFCFFILFFLKPKQNFDRKFHARF